MTRTSASRRHSPTAGRLATACCLWLLAAAGVDAAPAPTGDPAMVHSTRQGIHEGDQRGEHDFDFLFGDWTVHHHRLTRRLAHSSQWEDFLGTTEARPILGGLGNMDDNVLQLPSGAYRAATVRLFNDREGTWSIWWFDARHPGQLDPPVTGHFEDGVGTFYADDTWEGRPIRVRFLWSAITAHSARWEQAFSDDAGQTWETNWIMTFERQTPR